MSLEEYVEKAKVAYEQGMGLINDMSGWTKFSEGNGIVIYYRAPEDSDLRAIKVDYYVDKPCTEVAKYCFHNYHDLNMEFSPGDFEYFNIREKLNENMHIHDVAINSIGPINGRELQTVGILLELGDDNYAEVGTSINMDRPIREGYVEAVLSYGVTLYEPVINDANRTHC